MSGFLKKMLNFSMEKKLSHSFGVITKMFIAAAALALAGILVINFQFATFKDTYYENDMLQMEIRKDLQLASKYVLWAVTEETKAGTAEVSEGAVVSAENVEKNIALLKESFDDTESIEKLEVQIAELGKIREEILSYAGRLENEEALDLFNNSYSKIEEEAQNTLIAIGEESAAEADAAYNMANMLAIGIIVSLTSVVIAVVIVCRKLAKGLTKIIAKPIIELESVATKIKQGDLDIEISYNGTDELGGLAESFRQTCDTLKKIIEDAGQLLNGIADGDFNVRTHAEEYYVGEFTTLLANIRRLNIGMSDTLSQINDASEQVNIGASQMSDGATSLAEGASEQAGAVEELTATIANVTELAEQAAEGATEAETIIKANVIQAQKSNQEMDELVKAMERISETSKEIENIITDIENIASQTNLLSLNASIEAARAGEAGRGFAVVADQIGKLATDSSKSAVTTRELIGKSIEEIVKGNQITEATSKAIEKIVEDMETIAVSASGSRQGAQKQAELLKEIQAGVEQIASVVQSNSASAQQTSAISEELSAQAETLKNMVGQFKLRV